MPDPDLVVPDEDEESAEQTSQIQSSQSTGINLVIQDQRGLVQDPKEQFINVVRLYLVAPSLISSTFQHILQLRYSPALTS